MIDATHLKCASYRRKLQKKGPSPSVRVHQGRSEPKVHAFCDGQRPPVIMLLSEGQMSDYNGGALMIDALPPARRLLGDKGTTPTGSRRSRSGVSRPASHRSPPAKPIEHDRILYCERLTIENTFDRLKHWRRTTPVTIDAHIRFLGLAH